MSRLYSSRGWVPLWLDGSGPSRPGRAALGELLAAASHGLDPADYNGAALDSMAGRLDGSRASARDLARLDLLLSLSMRRYLDDLHTGRARFFPFARPAEEQVDWVATLAEGVEGDSIPRLVEASEPRLTQYRNLRLLLAKYRTLAADSALPRVHQIELALERLRWLPRLSSHPFLVVNIPAFQLFAFDSAGGAGAPSLTMKVVVGKAMDAKTPMLFQRLRYVEFRPYWNVPRSVLLAEMLPRLRRQPEYLRRHDMEVVSGEGRALGDSISPEIIRRLTKGELRVRQRPGPANALGLVKFAFPNAAGVYMHGTPERELFSQARRDFSHGCIRVEDPAAVAAWVLGFEEGWPPERIASAMKGTATVRVVLTLRLDVAVYYTTVVATPDGTPEFYRDVYGRDEALTELLRRTRPAPPAIAEAPAPT